MTLVGSDQLEVGPLRYAAILKALRPEQVIDLAMLTTATTTDLMATFRALPNRDIAMLAYYGLVELAPASSGYLREVKVVHETCHDLIAEAACVCARVARNHLFQVTQVITR